jgi:hypothetical protein
MGVSPTCCPLWVSRDFEPICSQGHPQDRPAHPTILCRVETLHVHSYRRWLLYFLFKLIKFKWTCNIKKFSSSVTLASFPVLICYTQLVAVIPDTAR